MKITPSGVAGIGLLGSPSPEFERALEFVLGKSPRSVLAPAIPYSVIATNDSGRTIALLGVRFDMTGPHAKPCSVIHYADTLRNPEKADFRTGTVRFVCAEPANTSLALRCGGEPTTRGRTSVDNLRQMLGIRASLDCVAWDDGRFAGPDSLGAFDRLARQREMEAELKDRIAGMNDAEAEKLLRAAAEDPLERARRTLARKLLEGLQTGGRAEMLNRAQSHRLKIAAWR